MRVMYLLLMPLCVLVVLTDLQTVVSVALMLLLTVL